MADQVDFSKLGVVDDTPKSTEEYANMPLEDVFLRATKNYTDDFVNTAKGLGRAIIDPVGTVTGLGKGIVDTGYRLGSLGYGALGGAQSPEEEEKNKQFAHSAYELATSAAPWKKAFAEHPVGFVSLAAGPMGKLAQTASTMGRAGTFLGTAGKVAASAMDPAQAVVQVGKEVGKYAPSLTRGAQSLLTGVAPVAFQKAFEAGANKIRGAREAFNEFYTGGGNPVQLSQDISHAIDTVRKEKSQDWVNTRGQITGAANQPVDYSIINQSLQNSWDNFGGVRGSQTKLFPDARKTLGEIEDLIRKEFEGLPPGQGKNTLQGLDELKKHLHFRMYDTSLSAEARQAYKDVAAGVRDTLKTMSPEYAALMDDYQYMLDELQNLQKTLGAGNKTSANVQLAKTIKSLGIPQGPNAIEIVGQIDPTIPYRVAGAALHAAGPSGIRAAVEGVAGAGGITAAALMQNPTAFATAVALAASGAIVSSPRIAGKLAYGAGKLAQAGRYVPTTAIKKSVYPVGLAVEQAQAAQQRLESQPGHEFDWITPDQIPTGQANGGRVGRKSGGRVGGGAESISREVAQTRKELSHRTSNMLSMPDDAIVTALKIAKH
jgi:hypothetical protein